ncbi:TetR-like C-terminal domain-containing protein [Streptomyces mirabilis]|uniref:TetR-like C-terminal domain-containing protein n=1 Tax=Streptomyces mirabilis TaxID=68239 RepID=UPI0036B18B12
MTRDERKAPVGHQTGRFNTQLSGSRPRPVMPIPTLTFAGENRALFDLMWRMTQFDFTASELAEQKHRALRVLDRSMRGEDAEPATYDTDPALLPSYAVWSLVHGYTTLALEGAIDSSNPDPLNSDLLPTMLALLDVALRGRAFRRGEAQSLNPQMR